MKKFLTIIGLLGFLSQPVLAQPLTVNPVTTPGYTTGGASSGQCCPAMQTNIIPPATTGCTGLTGAAAAAMKRDASNLPAPDTLQAVPIRRPLLLNRTGYIPVCPTSNCPNVTGAAASVTPVGCPAMRTVFIPKQRWWERNEYKMMPVCQTANCPAQACPVAPSTGGASTVAPPVEVKPIPSTGAAAPAKKKPVRGYW